MPDDPKQPATKADIAALREDLAAQEQRTSESLTALEDRLKEFLRDIETRLLKAFHGYAETQEHRVVRLEAFESDFNLRLSALEKRVLDLELRPSIPPPPPNQ